MWTKLIVFHIIKMLSYFLLKHEKFAFMTMFNLLATYSLRHFIKSLYFIFSCVHISMTHFKNIVLAVELGIVCCCAYDHHHPLFGIRTDG